MPNQMVRDLVSELPWAMRNSVEGYVDAVADALSDIEREAGFTLPNGKAEEFLFLVAVRRIWTIVNSQYWIINDSVSIAEFVASRDFRPVGINMLLVRCPLQKAWSYVPIFRGS